MSWHFARLFTAPSFINIVQKGGSGFIPYRDILGPLVLMALTPGFSIVLWYTSSYLSGDFGSFASKMINDPMFIYKIWPAWRGPESYDAWNQILSFMAFQLALMRLVPGKVQ